MFWVFPKMCLKCYICRHLPAKSVWKKTKFLGPKCWWLFSGKKFELLKLIIGFSFWQSKFLLFQKLNFYIITITHMYCIWKKISSRNFSHISRRYILIWNKCRFSAANKKRCKKHVYFWWFEVRTFLNIFLREIGELFWQNFCNCMVVLYFHVEIFCTPLKIRWRVKNLFF